MTAQSPHQTQVKPTYVEMDHFNSIKGPCVWLAGVHTSSYICSEF